jgi:hypothetical protein
VWAGLPPPTWAAMGALSLLWHWQELLGSGAQGVVYTAVTLAGTTVAMKVSRQRNSHTERELAAVRGGAGVGGRWVGER